MSTERAYRELSVNSLVPFANHPFELYDDSRLDDMVESIRANGVYTPIIVRPAESGKYEILSGHNRVAATKKAGLENIPAIVREDVSNEEAMFIVTETNLIQRSFTEMKHSERAVVITVHYEAMKKKSGYRSDLLEGVENENKVPLAPRTNTSRSIGEQYGLSSDTIKRYIRVNKLIQPLKDRLDNGEIALRVAVTLSYLKEPEMVAVENQLESGKKLSIKIANLLLEESKGNELSKEFIKRAFEPSFFQSKVKPIKFSGQFLSEFFDESKSSDEIEKTVAEALKMYFSNRS